MTEKGENDEWRKTGGKVGMSVFPHPPPPPGGGDKVKKITNLPLSHTPLSRDTYPAVASYLQRGNEERGIGGFCQIVTFLTFGKLFATY